MIQTTAGDALTARQQAVLDYIVKCLEVEHQWPTCAQISGDFGFASANAAHEHIDALCKKGRIMRNARGRLMLAGARVQVFAGGRGQGALQGYAGSPWPNSCPARLPC